ncbi:MAG: acyltransferase family protein [Asticcacaulis sp.]
MTNAAQTHAGTDGRYYALDVVRGGALMLGVVLHGGLAYMEPRVWIIGDTATDPAVNAVFFVIHMFRMSLFFLLAGFFARLLYQKRGAGGFALDRLKRVAGPLGIFWFPVLAVIITFLIMGALKADPSLASKPPAPPPPLTVDTFPLTHLWFLYVLLIFYAVFVPLRGLVAFIDRGGSLRRAADTVFRLALKSGLTGVLFGLPLFLVILVTPKWLYWFGIATPDTGLIPNALALSGYGSAFVAGWLLHRNVALLEVVKKQWLGGLISAIGFTFICLWLGRQGDDAQTIAGSTRPLYAAAYILGLWSWCIGLTGLALRFLDRPSAVWRYIADASYWVYIVHLPLVLALQYLLLDMDWPVGAKLWAVIAGTFALSLLSYQLLVRYSFIGAILSGRKPVRKARATFKEKQA